jgi:hypothetical protein
VKTVRNPSEIYFGRNLGRKYDLRRGCFGQRPIRPNSVRKRIFVRNPWEVSVNSVPNPSEIPFENDFFLVVSPFSFIIYYYIVDKVYHLKFLNWSLSLVSSDTLLYEHD